MVFCDENRCLGGEDEEELLSELCINGLLERFEGLVLLGLGPPAMLSLSGRYRAGRVRDKAVRWWRSRRVASEQMQCRSGGG